jgi:serine protease inhibitor
LHFGSRRHDLLECARPVADGAACYDLPRSALHHLQSTRRADQSASRHRGRQPLQLRIANAVWVEQTLKLLDQYLDVIARNYGAGVRLADSTA